MPRPTALITGIAGQDGAYLAKKLLDSGYDVCGGISRPQQDLWRLKRLGIDKQVLLFPLDLTNHPQIDMAIAEIRPDEIYNFGALSSLGKTETDESLTQAINYEGPLHLFRRALDFHPDVRIFQASSAFVFGEPSTAPQNENTSRAPVSNYGKAKHALDLELETLRQQGAFAVSGILYNHESPLRGDEFVSQKIVQTLTRIKQGSGELLQLGALDDRRDWSYAGDFVDAIILAMQREKPTDYVLSSGEVNNVRGWINYSAKTLDLKIVFEGQGAEECVFDASTGRKIAEVNPAFIRDENGRPLVGDSTKAKAELGWHAQMTFPDLVRRMTVAALSRQGV